jgi:hypothetical protein
MKGKILISMAALALLMTGNASAQPRDCEARLQAIGHTTTSLQAGAIITLDGQRVTYQGGPAQAVCDMVDRLNDPLRKKDALIAQLTTERNIARAQVADLTRRVNEQGPLQQHVYLLFGWAVGSTVFAFMLATIRFWGLVTRTPSKF